MVGFDTGVFQLFVALVECLNKLRHCVSEAVRDRILSKEFRVQLHLVQCGINGKKKNELGQVLT